jgi:uncharacterized SAM-dependent methyltransferase
MVRTPGAVLGEIRRALEERTVLPAHLFYEAGGGAANWAELTTDDAYASATDSATLFRDDSTGIARAVAEAAGEKPLGILSLGPGTGWKDELLVRAIGAGPPRPGPLRYFALDASPVLAVQAMTRVLVGNALAPTATATAGTEAAALVARFEDLPALRPVYESPGAVNVVMLLGSTLGNLADEQGLLRLLGAATRPDDLLLLEVTIQRPGTDEIAALGDPLAIRRFNFEPLAALGVRFVPENMGYRVASGRSTIRDTSTIVASYRDFVVDGEPYQSADLALLHRYRAAAIPEALSAAGFTLCRPPWFGPQRRSMLVLARRAPLS